MFKGPFLGPFFLLTNFKKAPEKVPLKKEVPASKTGGHTVEIPTVGIPERNQFVTLEIPEHCDTPKQFMFASNMGSITPYSSPEQSIPFSY